MNPPRFTGSPSPLKSSTVAVHGEIRRHHERLKTEMVPLRAAYEQVQATLAGKTEAELRKEALEAEYSWECKMDIFYAQRRAKRWGWTVRLATPALIVGCKCSAWILRTFVRAPLERRVHGVPNPQDQ